MAFLDKLAYRFRKIAVKNLMLYIASGQFLVFLIDILMGSRFSTTLSQLLEFDRSLILQGQVWRVISFIFIPPSQAGLTGLFFIFFVLYFYWMIGNSLENEWGAAKFNLYYYFCILFLIAAGFISGYNVNTFLNLSLFFAFAVFYPNYQINLFFVLPIKIKWLAYVDALYFLLMLILGPWAIRASVIASVAVFLLFFGKQLSRDIKNFTLNMYNRKKYKKSVAWGKKQNKDYWKNR
ncbi:MAG TPA: hypothetical protein PK854_05660 [Oscillospiraceae bacterium]|nr:hypothetical protein [Oscillospiraceae bacterium]HPS34730.1 hypothetical protein [Oscillospiraceae bacterium]